MDPEGLLAFLEESVTDGDDARDDIALLVVRCVGDPGQTAPPDAQRSIIDMVPDQTSQPSASLAEPSLD